MLNEKDRKRIIDEAVELALVRNKDLVIGSIVGHKSRTDSMRLDDIIGNMGVVAIHPKNSPNGQMITIELPLAELFDVSLVSSLAYSLTTKAVLEKIFQNPN
jgi:hypothetical protein